MSFLSDILTTSELDSMKSQVKNYLKVIICITIGLLIYSLINDIIKRYLYGFPSFVVKSLIAFLLLYGIVRF